MKIKTLIESLGKEGAAKALGISVRALDMVNVGKKIPDRFVERLKELMK